MQISDLAKKTNTSPRSLRHYESSGLLTPLRTESGYRHYSEDHIDAVQKIRWLIGAGLNVKTIKEILPCVLDDKKIVMCPKVRALVVSEAERLEKQISDLKKSQRILQKALQNGLPPPDREASPNMTVNKSKSDNKKN